MIHLPLRRALPCPRRGLALPALASSLALVAPLLGGCPQDPGELRPLFEEVLGLPGFEHPAGADPDNPSTGAPDTGWPRFEMPVRNIGESAVTISSVAMRDSDEAGAADAYFGTAAVDVTEVDADEQAIVRFTYVTPGGNGHTAELVIASDATNAELVIPVVTLDYVEPDEPDGGPEPMDAGPDPEPDPEPDPPADAGAGDGG